MKVMVVVLVVATVIGIVVMILVRAGNGGGNGDGGDRFTLHNVEARCLLRRIRLPHLPHPVQVQAPDLPRVDTLSQFWRAGRPGLIRIFMLTLSCKYLLTLLTSSPSPPCPHHPAALTTCLFHSLALRILTPPDNFIPSPVTSLLNTT